jgi:hypothetical protein
MVHLDRIHEEIRVLNLKDETLLSFRVFVNFTKRMDLFNGIEMGILPDRVTLTDEETVEREYLNKYFTTLEKLFPELAAKWNRRSV